MLLRGNDAVLDSTAVAAGQFDTILENQSLNICFMAPLSEISSSRWLSAWTSLSLTGIASGKERRRLPTI